MNPERRPRSCGRRPMRHDRLGLAIRSPRPVPGELATVLGSALAASVASFVTAATEPSGGRVPALWPLRPWRDDDLETVARSPPLVLIARGDDPRGCVRPPFGGPPRASAPGHRSRQGQQAFDVGGFEGLAVARPSPRSITASLGRGGSGPSQPGGARRSDRSLRPSSAARRAGRCPVLAGLGPPLRPRPRRAGDRGEGRGPPGLLPAADGERPC